MKTEMNIGEAKAKLSSLVQKALDGEEVVLARDGVPAVRLVPVEPKPKIRLGLLRDKYGYAHDLPYEAFAPDPRDAETSVFPDDVPDDMPDDMGEDEPGASGR